MIQIGSKVRSYDFPDDNQWRQENGKECYVEGTVIGFKTVEGCDRYVIQVERKVWAGKEVEKPYKGYVYPPVNGTPKISGVCNGVELI